MIARQASNSPRRDRRLKHWIAGVFEEWHLRYTTSRGILDWPVEVPPSLETRHGQLVQYLRKSLGWTAPIEPYFTSLCKLYFPSADDCNLLSTQWASIFSILCAAPLLGKSWATYDRACIRNGSRLFGTMHIAKTKTFSSAENFPLRIFDGMCLPIWHLKGNSFRAGLKTPGEGAELRNEIYLNAAFFFLLAFCFAESITRQDMTSTTQKKV